MSADPNDATRYDDCGFDIYHLDTPLNFDTLGTQGGRKFCILKVTEASTVEDPEFAPRVRQLISTNIKRLGAYHFAHHSDPVGQMNFFIDTYKAAIQGITPTPNFLFMLDLEINPHEDDPPQEADGLAMVQQLQSIGINPIIYCGRDFWSQSHAELLKCPHLLAAYNKNPVSALPWRIPGADTYGWDMWQYTSGDPNPKFGGPWAKTIPGGSPTMDLDCFNLVKHPKGLEDWWDARLKETPQP